ncbi:transporter protein [Fructobacillus pseudoficulneus]|uniref:Transporter protein n=1 Tax=Fructobacillus pseudoficulneus TaxID=220714 RepID=A0A3F3GU47_9LACO|nr:DUF805 domain-containing protein [Fructobacillus pseudoficulneus]GAP02905.1 transporter protein [Fructobacillus pseudoficulneus]SEH46750.1 Uncharacterized membrane protein YhaH, DUF805 family [Fructobacillus pseudoficulneus]
MLQAYKKFWKNYVNLKEPSTRADYWWFTLVNTLISLVWFLVVLGTSMRFLIKLIDGRRITSADTPMLIVTVVVLLIGLLYVLATFIPKWTLMYRRFMDTGLNPWWYSIYVIAYLLRFVSGNSSSLTAVWVLLNIAVFVITVSPTGAYKKDK